MALGEWTSGTGASDYSELIGAKPWSNPATIEVDAGTGTVVLKFLESDDTTWTVFETLDTDQVKKIDMANMPVIRVYNTGDAKHRVTWEG